MNNQSLAKYRTLKKELDTLVAAGVNLPGIKDKKSNDVFIRQLIDSIRRVKYGFTIASRPASKYFTDPNDIRFDPLKAAVHYSKQGKNDEACWLVFLATHFGKSNQSGWRLTMDFYGAIGNRIWDWDTVTANLADFEDSTVLAYQKMTQDNIVRVFSNHRKYESIRPNASRPFATVSRSYIAWVTTHLNHGGLFLNASNETDGTPRQMFDFLYKSMNGVISFGRTGRFDYLTMLAKLGLADIDPPRTYMEGATGPYNGANLIFGLRETGAAGRRKLEKLVDKVEAGLSLGPLGMQVMEDALCNWQKHPRRYVYFKG